VKYDAAKGLTITADGDTGKLAANLGDGLTFDGDGKIAIELDANSGLSTSANGLKISASNCITGGLTFNNGTWGCFNINNGTLTLQRNGEKLGEFTANQSDPTTINFIDNNTTYTAGNGLTLTGGSFSINLRSGSGLRVDGNGLGLASCTATGQILKWNQTSQNWGCANHLPKSDICESMYPVSSIYLSMSNTNPSSSLGCGTWVAWGAGRVPIGAGTGTDSNGSSQNFATGQTGGEYNHTLTINEMPSHTHNDATQHGGEICFYDGTNFANCKEAPDTWYTGSDASGWPTSATGGSQSHNNVQPYITCYMWRRTS
jgi:hypothetical protein